VFLVRRYKVPRNTRLCPYKVSSILGRRILILHVIYRWVVGKFDGGISLNKGGIHFGMLEGFVRYEISWVSGEQGLLYLAKL